MDTNGIGIATLPYIMGGALFLLLSVKLVTQTAPTVTRKANLLLALLCFVFAMIEMDEFVGANQLSFSFYAVFEKIQNAAHLLLGPLTFLYLMSMTDKPTLNKIHIAHLGGFILGLVLMWMPLHKHLTLGLFIGLYLFSLLSYTYVCLKKLNVFDLSARQQLSDLQHHNLIGIKVWVYLMAFISIYIVMSPLYKWYFERQEGPLDVHYILALFAAYLLIRHDFSSQLALSDLINLVDFRSDSIAKERKNKNIEPDSECESDKSQALNSGLNENQLIYKTLDKMVKQSQLYLKNGLSLADLAKVIGYSNNQISAVINQENGQCFYDYVNGYRIEEAKRILVQSPAKAIVDVALASGFNSKSAFYTAFSKQGIGTPNEFRRKQLILPLNADRE